MPRLELPYGRGELRVHVPAANLQAILAPRQPVRSADEAALVRTALANPIGTPRLLDLVRPGQKVVIVTSDLTRPCPSERLLPPILEELTAARLPSADVSVIMALGLHRPMTEGEMKAAVGPNAYRRIPVVNHDPDDTVQIGSTTAGSPVEVFRPIVEADVRICLGNVELHYFAGYSGGFKAILPGCASKRTVEANHAMMVRPEATAGRLEGNPVRADIEEGVDMLGATFLLNVVVDGQHRIVDAAAGQVIDAHRRACKTVADRSRVPIRELADIVLVSAGGYPRDVNLYQAQKALHNAAHAVRQSGIIILVAECGEGMGNETFENWMQEARSPDEILDRIAQKFVLGGHKAAAIAEVMKGARVFLVSALPEKLARSCGFVPFPDLREAVNAAGRETGEQAEWIVLPHGGAVLPERFGCSHE